MQRTIPVDSWRFYESRKTMKISLQYKKNAREYFNEQNISKNICLKAVRN